MKMSSEATQPPAACTSNISDEESGIKFNPPVYQQRYQRVHDILKRELVTSVVDFGCAECRSLRLFKDLPLLERLIGVDIDEALLVKYHSRVRPLISHYLIRRSKQLVVSILHGNLLEWDSVLEDIEAVTMIEVIEHLFYPDLQRLPQALFGVIQPKLVVITTPNADFNELFTGLIGFRHPDHKFEWTRHEFSEWCCRVCNKYGYSVEYDGVGEAPEGSQHLGFCSQIAIFRRSDVPYSRYVRTEARPYTQIHEYEYPGQPDDVTAETRLQNNALYYLRLLCRSAADNLHSPASSSSSASDTTHEEVLRDPLLEDSSLLRDDISEDLTCERVMQNPVSEVVTFEEFMKDTTGEEVVREEDGSRQNGEDELDVNYIKLSHLMSFRELQQDCGGDVDILRRVLSTAGYSFTSDRKSVICPVEIPDNKYYLDDEEDDKLVNEQSEDFSSDVATVLKFQQYNELDEQLECWD